MTTLDDGFVRGGLDVFMSISPVAAARLLSDAGRPLPRETAVNAFVVRAEGRVALIDCGCGNSGPKTAGRLLDALAVSGVRPHDVDTILMTHLHPDHAGGLTDANGAATFPNARLHLHRAELDYWSSDDAAREVARTGQGVACFEEARRSIEPYGGRLGLLGAEAAFPGVTAVPLSGHTPGHTGYLVASGGDRLLIWGDIVHAAEIQVPHPEVSLRFDVDPERAAETRRDIFARVVAERLLVAGMHLRFPGFGRLVESADGPRLVSGPGTDEPAPPLAPSSHAAAGEPMIYDHRTYVCRAGTVQKHVALYLEHGFRAQCRHLGRPLVYATTEIGDPNSYVHVWAYESMADMERKRAALRADPEWQAYLEVTRAAGYLQSQNDVLLRPVDLPTS